MVHETSSLRSSRALTCGLASQSSRAFLRSLDLAYISRATLSSALEGHWLAYRFASLLRGEAGRREATQLTKEGVADKVCRSSRERSGRERTARRDCTLGPSAWDNIEVLRSAKLDSDGDSRYFVMRASACERGGGVSSSNSAYGIIDAGSRHS